MYKVYGYKVVNCYRKIVSSEKSLLENHPDYLVCTCMCVMYSDIVQAIQNGAQDFQALQDELLVGTGCSSCIQEVCEIFEENS